jgi:hypothetical protein
MHYHARPAVIRALHPNRSSNRNGHTNPSRSWPAAYRVVLAALLGLAGLIRAVVRPRRDDAPRPGDHRHAMPTLREVSPVGEAKRISATQRERVRASLIARPGPAKPAHRRWAEPGS